MKKNILYLLVPLLIFSCSQKEKPNDKLNGSDILLKSIEVHDPNQNWDSAELNIHIQEPRIKNPFRYSEVRLNISNGKFELIRNRENNVSKHTIDKNGLSKVYFNDSEQIEKKYIEKYRLNPKMNDRYRKFYKMLIGLPMSLKSPTIKGFEEVGIETYNGAECYMVPVTLNEEMFSKNWILYIAKSTFKFKGMEIVFPGDDTKGERLFFDGEFIIDEMTIPRIRHWYEYSNNDYSGTDIIIKQLE